MDIKRDETAKYGKRFDFFSIDRPWGFFQCICENSPLITVKIININKSEMLSLQRHKDRDQFYYIIDPMQIQYEVENSMIETINAESGETFYFPRGTLHRAINNTEKEYARFFEVCWGVNDESDITRVADKYSRGDG